MPEPTSPAPPRLALTYLAFLGWLLLLAALIAVPAYFVVAHYNVSAINPALGALGFSALLTAAVYRITSSGLFARPAGFMGAVLGGMGLKLILSIAAVAVLVLLFRPQAVPVVTVYFSGYIVFTAFEVYALLANLRANSKSTPAKGPTYASEHGQT